MIFRSPAGDHRLGARSAVKPCLSRKRPIPLHGDGAQGTLGVEAPPPIVAQRENVTGKVKELLSGRRPRTHVRSHFSIPSRERKLVPGRTAEGPARNRRSSGPIGLRSCRAPPGFAAISRFRRTPGYVRVPQSTVYPSAIWSSELRSRYELPTTIRRPTPLLAAAAPQCQDIGWGER